MGAFHAYDIRGIYNKDFNREDVYKIGFFLPGLLNADAILVGRDARESTPEIFEYLCRGIADAGADVHDAGLTTTPMIYWGTARFGFNASVMITASHNPREYNGMKVSGKNAVPVGYDSGLQQLEQLIQTETSLLHLKRETLFLLILKMSIWSFSGNIILIFQI
jgi:phosphomannomutase